MTNLELALSEEIKHPVKINSMQTRFENSDCNVAVDFQINCTTIPGCYEDDDKEEIPFCDMCCSCCEEIEEELCADYEPPLWGIPDIERIIFNPPATVVYWIDGTKTVVKAMEGEKYEKYAGFAMACMKKMFGSTGAAKHIMAEYDDTPEPKPKKEKTEPKKERSINNPAFKDHISQFLWEDIMNMVLGTTSRKEEEKKDEAPAE